MWIKSLNRLINSDQVQQFYCAENASGQGGGVIIVYQGGAFETFSEHATMEKAKETLGKLYRLLGQGSSVPPAETAAPVKEANDKEAKEAPPVPPVPLCGPLLAPSPVRLKCESDCRNALANLDQSVIGAWHKYMEEAYGSAKVGEIAAENLEKLLDQLQNALREAATKAKHDKATAQGTNFQKTDFQKTDFQKTDFQKTDFQKGAVAANPL